MHSPASGQLLPVPKQFHNLLFHIRIQAHTLLVRSGLEQVFGKDCLKVKDSRQAKSEYSQPEYPGFVSYTNRARESLRGKTDIKKFLKDLGFRL